MAFTFGGASTPAFGATSTPAFSFGGAASTPAFGTTANPAFGAQTPAFGATTAPAFGAGAPSLFGASTAAAPSPFGGGGVSTPAFSFSSASMFGGMSTPAFGGPTSTPSMFGATTAPSLFGAPAVAQPQAAQQAIPQLVTKENRPLTHSTKWEDLSPQAQQYLMELEKVVSTYAQECHQLDGEERLQSVAGARPGLDTSAHALSQSVATLGVRLRSDVEEAQTTRSAVMHLLRHTEAAVHAFKRAHAWREAGRAAPGQPLPSHVAEMGGPVALPSGFLVETIEALHDRLRSHEVAAAELEAVLNPHDGRYSASVSGDPNAVLNSLHSSVTNLHDCLMRTAAQLQALDDRVSSAKAVKLAAMRQAGDMSDPFSEAERHEMNADKQQRDADARKKASQQHNASQQQHGGQSSAQMMPQAAPAATGIFGTATPGQGFDSPGIGLFGNTASSRRKTGRR